MRLGVERKACPSVPLSGTGFRYSVEIKLTYKDTITKTLATTLIAPDLTGTEAPVEFPPIVDGSVDAEIVANSRVQTCETVFKSKIVNGSKVTLKHLKCGPAATIDTETYTVRVREPGGAYFTLEYDDVEMDGQMVYLDLDDNDSPPSVQ
jgi:hypothetical protein